jgi:hypothetical protein
MAEHKAYDAPEHGAERWKIARAKRAARLEDDEDNDDDFDRNDFLCPGDVIQYRLHPELWDSEMVTDDEDEYDEEEDEYDDEYDELEEEPDKDEVEDFLEAMSKEQVDLEELGRAARAAVEEFQSETVKENEMEDLGMGAGSVGELFESRAERPETDWSQFTVAQLRDELRSRGLHTAGKKADLVAMLTADDLEPSTEEEMAWKTDIEETSKQEIEQVAQGEPDLDELGRAARAAVEVFEGDNKSELEFEAMTVNELKDELRNRGLKITGRKAELIQ